MSSNLSASIIICSYNREELFVNTVKYALAQKHDKLEILIIDQTNNHNEATTKFLEEIKSNPKVHYFFSDRPSVTKARNIGLKNATGDILIYIDDDTEFDENFVSHHLAVQEEGYDVVQGRVIEKGNSPQSEKPLWLSRRLKFSGSDDCENVGPTNVITGCNFSVKRSVAEAVGGFDERFTRLDIREDADFGYRCYRKGYKMVFSPVAKLKHLRSDFGGVGSGIGMHFFNESYYYHEMLFCKNHFSPLVQIYYKIRLKLRGKKALSKLIKYSFAQAEKK